MGKRLALPEFILLTALLFSLIAFGTDAMLPAFGEMAADLNTSNANRVQLVVAAFVLGTGCGQLISGPLSDAIGRKPVLLGGIGVFIITSFWAWGSQSLEMLLLARFIQGLGISAPRTVGMAMVRDLYTGRQMARVVSLAMMMFVLVPAVAPLIGQGIMLAFGWRAIFMSFVVLGCAVGLWLWIRQEETHTPERRRPMRVATMISAAKEMAASRRVVISLLVLCMSYAIVFSYISSAQQLFVVWLDAGARFPVYFAIIALVSGTASALNAALVVRLGMWLLSTIGLALLAVGSISVGTLIASGLISGDVLLYVVIGWSMMLFFLSGLVFSNVNALAMEPMGHIAGTASAIIGSVSTLASILIAVPIGQMFNGTGLPLMFGVGTCAAIGFFLNLQNPRSV
ncbi:multidrug effflux MFS transporter [Neptunicoccus cionae]|uniref:Bcr/CflA family efflux transporter n=1 Tax=Neptunicoccus cionae TaxID=2035344 RepID=A0A916QUC9_9RHOB|nr:multidrug effflux MFS transporter [Amylibacter cionae]GGA11356.1 MFS transporter [Amylibacter cionae]